MNRRTFPSTSLGAATASAALAAPAPILLRFDTYSLNRLNWKAIQLLD